MPYKTIPVSPQTHADVQAIAKANFRSLGGQIDAWVAGECEHPEDARDYYEVVTLSPGEDCFRFDTRKNAPASSKVLQIFICEECHQAFSQGEIKDATIVMLTDETATVDVGENSE